MVLFWELKFFDLMVRHHAGVMSENHKGGSNIANSHTGDTPNDISPGGSDGGEISPLNARV